MPFASTYFLRDRLDLIAQFQHFLDLARQRFERFDDHAVPSDVERWRIRPKQQPDQRENGNLRRERFRRRDANLRSGMHVNAAIALARDRAGDVVANSERAITFASAFAQRAECVRGFAALADGENERVASHRRVAMAKLARVFDFGWECGRVARSNIRRPSRHAARCRIR